MDIQVTPIATGASACAVEARRQGCAAVHLDSGVGQNRAAAHRLYMRHHYRIGCHHFVKVLSEA